MTFKLEDLITNDDRQEGEAGITLDDVSAALLTLRAMRAKPLSVREAADIFDCEIGVIGEAVENAYWLFLEGTMDLPGECMIDMEGE